MRTFLHRLFGLTRTRSFDASGGGRGWEGARTVDGLNTAILAGATTAARRATWYARNNPWVTASVDSLVGNVVGAGIKPKSTHPDRAARERLQALWLRWTDHADQGGLADFYGLQAMAVRAMIESGEGFARLRVTPDTGAIPLRLELLDREQVPMDLHREIGGGARIRAGIEFDSAGRRVAYRVSSSRPGDPLGSVQMDPIRVPAADCLHLFKPLAAGQLRGITWLAPVLLRLHELDQFEDAALVKAKVAALFTGFITDPDGTAGGLSGGNSAGALTVGMEPGSLIPLPPGTDIRFSNPTEHDAYAPFVKNHLRAVAAGLGLPYELVSGDLEGVTYSSIRAGLIEFRRRVEQLQHNVVVHLFCRPVWERFVRLAALTGDLPARDFDRTHEAAALGLRTRQRVNADGSISGRRHFTRGHVHQILTNPVYSGRIRHRAEVYEGQHAALIEPAIWEEVQRRLGNGAARHRGECRRAAASVLAGKLFDETGDRLTPSHAVKDGRRFRYYVSRRLVTDPRAEHPDAWRLPAQPLERGLIATIQNRLARPGAPGELISNLTAREVGMVSGELLRIVGRLSAPDAAPLLGDILAEVRLGAGVISIQLDADWIAGALGIPRKRVVSSSLQIEAPLQLRRRGVEMKLVLGDAAPTQDLTLIRHVVQARDWYARLTAGESLSAIAASEGLQRQRVHLLLDMALLSPDLLAAIVAGRQPPALTSQWFRGNRLSMLWPDQRKAFEQT